MNIAENCRLFIAMPVPAAYYRLLGALQQYYRDYTGIRWVPENNLHVTVFFIGNIASSNIPEIAIVMRDCLTNVSPFTLKFKSVILKGSGKHPGMVWAMFDKNDNFTALANALDHKLRPLGATPARFPEPVPHITLARIRNMEIPGIPDVMGENIPFRGFELWSSHSTPEGVRYESIPF